MFVKHYLGPRGEKQLIPGQKRWLREAQSWLQVCCLRCPALRGTARSALSHCGEKREPKTAQVGGRGCERAPEFVISGGASGLVLNLETGLVARCQSVLGIPSAAVSRLRRAQLPAAGDASSFVIFNI